MPEMHRRFVGSWIVHVEKPNGPFAVQEFLCGTNVFDDTAMTTAVETWPPTTCLWCVAGKNKWS